MKNKTIIAFQVLAFLSASLSYASTETGNGGKGERRGENIYLQDFVVTGVEENPFQKPLAELNANVLKFYTDRLSRTTLASMDLLNLSALAGKLTEIDEVDQVFSRSLLKSIEMQSWRLVTASLTETTDGSSVIRNKNEIQLAIRRGRVILINRKFWNQLRESDRVGLLIHESVYALISPEQNADKVSFSQNADRVREIVGELFAPEIYRRGKQALADFIGDKWAGAHAKGLPFERQVALDLITSQTFRVSRGKETISYAELSLLNFDGRYQRLTASRAGRNTIMENSTTGELRYNAAVILLSNAVDQYQDNSRYVIVYAHESEVEKREKIVAICDYMASRGQTFLISIPHYDSYRFENKNYKNSTGDSFEYVDFSAVPSHEQILTFFGFVENPKLSRAKNCELNTAVLVNDKFEDIPALLK